MNVSSYSTIQKLLHWVSAVIIVWSLLSGFFVAVFTVPAPVKAWVAFFNVSLTTVYIPVFVLRVYYSFGHGLDFSIKRTLPEYAALLVHKSMYLMLALVLITGVLMMDRPINVFNLASITPVHSDPAIIAWYTSVHVLLCLVLLLMLIAHVGAVVMHERRGKRVMARMWFRPRALSDIPSGRGQRRQLRQFQRHQQCANQQRHDEPANPVPPGEVPEKAACRAGNTRSRVVAKQVQRRRLPLGLDCAAADPAAGHRVCAEEAEGEDQHTRHH